MLYFLEQVIGKLNCLDFIGLMAIGKCCRQVIGKLNLMNTPKESFSSYIQKIRIE